MLNLSNNKIPFSETRHYLVKPYEPNFYVISTAQTAKFGAPANTTEMTEIAKLQSSVPCNFLTGRKRCKSSVHASINELPTNFILHKIYEFIITYCTEISFEHWSIQNSLWCHTLLNPNSSGFTPKVKFNATFKTSAGEKRGTYFARVTPIINISTNSSTT